MKNLNKIEQAGRSMVEMLGVLAIIGVLSVGGISGYSKAMAKFKLTKVQDQLSMMVMNIRTAYATSPGYPGLTTNLAANNKLVSQEMVAGSSASRSLMHALGGPAEVGAVTANGITNAGFAIVLSGLGKDACVSLASSDWGTDGMLGITIISTTATLPTTVGNDVKTPKDLPISYSDAISACASDSANSITWFYN